MASRPEFAAPGLGRVTAGALFASTRRAWEESHGRTVLFVVDDQIQHPAELSDERELQAKVCEPFNVEVRFAPECATGSATGASGAWFEAVLARLSACEAGLAGVLLDIMFEGEWDPLKGSGLGFLRRLYEAMPGVPVMIMTQARSEPELAEALARSGLHLSFLSKDAPDRVGGIARFLFEFGWVSMPEFGAFSVPMRRELSRLRRYAVVQPRLETGFPQPILFLAESGDGKTRSARRAAEWLAAFEPSFRTSQAAEYLDCNTLERGQGAQIALFGRGPRDRTERIDGSGLSARGKAQRANKGVLIIDELGNSSPAFQEMLLSFVETGRTQPEWVHDGMTAEALGPLNVLCEFTAQPRHVLEGRINEDLARRYARGTTLVYPPLSERPADVLPILLSTADQAWARARLDRSGDDPRGAAQVLSEVESWLLEIVAEYRLSASAVVDLVGQPEVFPIGVPYLENRLPQVLAPRRTPPEGPEAVRNRPDRPRPRSTEPPESADSREQPRPGTLGRGIAPTALDRFSSDPRALRGHLQEVVAASARTILRFLESCTEAASGGRDRINIRATYGLAAGSRSHRESVGVMPGGAEEKMVSTATARSRLKDLLLISPVQTATEIRRSDSLARLAIRVADGERSAALQRLLEALTEDSAQKARLRDLGWRAGRPVPKRTKASPGMNTGGRRA